MDSNSIDIILASASPRRNELLRSIFKSFRLMPQNVDENICESNPKEHVKLLAEKKLNNLDKIYPNSLIISADTIVYFNNKIYGKPKDKVEAEKFLKELSNNSHDVFTGICVCFKGERYLDVEQSKVIFKNLTQQQIEDYIRNKNPLDKAGAYGIQDDDVVDYYVGSYTNIVGLPIEKLKDILYKLEVIQWEAFN